MRRFLLLFFLFLFAVFGWRDFVASGRFVDYLDAHPHRRGTASALFYLARYYELFSKDDKALPLYQRVAERYPKSRYGVDAHYGVAASYERLKRYHEALARFEEFLEKFPDSPYRNSVRSNIEILKSR